MTSHALRDQNPVSRTGENHSKTANVFRAILAIKCIERVRDKLLRPGAPSLHVAQIRPKAIFFQLAVRRACRGFRFELLSG